MSANKKSKADLLVRVRYQNPLPPPPFPPRLLHLPTTPKRYATYQFLNPLQSERELPLVLDGELGLPIELGKIEEGKSGDGGKYWMGDRSGVAPPPPPPLSTLHHPSTKRGGVSSLNAVSIPEADLFLFDEGSGLGSSSSTSGVGSGTGVGGGGVPVGFLSSGSGGSGDLSRSGGMMGERRRTDVSWLRRTEYLSSEAAGSKVTATGSGSGGTGTGGFKNGSEGGSNPLRRGTHHYQQQPHHQMSSLSQAQLNATSASASATSTSDPLISLTREAQAKSISATFSACAVPLSSLRHPTKAHLKAEEVWDVLPDEDLWSNEMNLVRFGEDPGAGTSINDSSAFASSSSTHLGADPRLPRAIFRPVEIPDQDNRIGYYLPETRDIAMAYEKKRKAVIQDMIEGGGGGGVNGAAAAATSNGVGGRIHDPVVGTGEEGLEEKYAEGTEEKKKIEEDEGEVEYDFKWVRDYEVSNSRELVHEYIICFDQGPIAPSSTNTATRPEDDVKIPDKTEEEKRRELELILLQAHQKKGVRRKGAYYSNLSLSQTLRKRRPRRNENARMFPRSTELEFWDGMAVKVFSKDLETVIGEDEVEIRRELAEEVKKMPSRI